MAKLINLIIYRPINYIYDTFYCHFFNKNIGELGGGKVDEVISELTRNSFYIYKGWLPKNELENLRGSCRASFKYKKESAESNSFTNYNIVHKKTRWTGIDADVDLVRDYKNNKFILDVAEKFHDERVAVLKTTYEQKEYNREQEDGSLSEIEVGDHLWHVDRPYGVLKTMLLLSDIDEEDGPFEIASGSHHLFSNGFLSFIYWLKIFIVYFCFGFGKGPYAEPNKENRYFPLKNINRLKGNAGDLVFVNTGAWHRGSSFSKNGYREVIWNYIYSQNRLTRIKIFRKLLGKL